MDSFQSLCAFPSFHVVSWEKNLVSPVWMTCLCLYWSVVDKHLASCSPEMTIFYDKPPASQGLVWGSCELGRHPRRHPWEIRISLGFWIPVLSFSRALQGVLTSRKYYLILPEENPRNKRMDDLLRVSWAVRGRARARSTVPCCLLNTVDPETLLVLKLLCSCH